MNQVADQWKDYECIDAGNGEKLERWKEVILRRPDPLALWPIEEEKDLWIHPHAHYHRSNKGGGHWEYKEQIPESWRCIIAKLALQRSVRPASNIPDYSRNRQPTGILSSIRSAAATQDIRVLNLFAYTGGATMAAAYGGAREVVHVDASKGMVQWAKENMMLSHLEDHKIRFIVDDVLKFVEREKRRGRTYHAIIMDPPSYGRGPKGEIWKIEEQLYPLVQACMQILDPEALFFLINSYTTGFPASVLNNILCATVAKQHPNGVIEYGEIGLPITKTKTVLPCGIYGRWVKQK